MDTTQLTLPPPVADFVISFSPFAHDDEFGAPRYRVDDELVVNVTRNMARPGKLTGNSTPNQIRDLSAFFSIVAGNGAPVASVERVNIGGRSVRIIETCPTDSMAANRAARWFWNSQRQPMANHVGQIWVPDDDGLPLVAWVWSHPDWSDDDPAPVIWYRLAFRDGYLAGVRRDVATRQTVLVWHKVGFDLPLRKLTRMVEKAGAGTKVETAAAEWASASVPPADVLPEWFTDRCTPRPA